MYRAGASFEDWISTIPVRQQQERERICKFRGSPRFLAKPYIPLEHGSSFFRKLSTMKQSQEFPSHLPPLPPLRGRLAPKFLIYPWKKETTLNGTNPFPTSVENLSDLLGPLTSF